MSENQAVAKIAIVCPQCGRVLNPDKGDVYIFCAKCGTKVLIDYHIYETIDHAEIERARADRDVRMREIELDEKVHEDSQSDQKLKYMDRLGRIIIDYKKADSGNAISKAEIKAKIRQEKLEHKRIKREAMERENNSTAGIIRTICFAIMFIIMMIVMFTRHH